MTLSNAAPEAPIDLNIDGTSQIAHAPLSDDLRAGRQRRITAVVLSIVTNILVILAIIITLPPLPTPLPKPISVKIVPPSAIAHPRPHAAQAKPRPNRPAPKPAPPKTAPRQAHLGSMASEDMGDPNAPKDSTKDSQTPAAGPAMPQEGSAQPEPTNKAPIVEKSEPTPIRGRVPSKKRGGAKVRAIMAPPHSSRRYAKVLGKDATENDYFAYFAKLVYSCMTPQIAADLDRLDSSHTLCFNVKHSGYITLAYVDPAYDAPGLDDDLAQLSDCMGRAAPMSDLVPDFTGTIPICRIPPQIPGQSQVQSLGSQFNQFNNQP